MVPPKQLLCFGKVVLTCVLQCFSFPFIYDENSG
jgi:hypothetical protein